MPSLRGQYIHKLFGIFLYRRFVPHILVGFNSLFWGIWEAVLWLQESAIPFLHIAFYEESPILVSRLLPGPVFLKIWLLSQKHQYHLGCDRNSQTPPQTYWIRNFSKSSWCMVKCKNHWFSQIVRKTCTFSFCQASNWSWGLHYLPEPIDESGLGWEWYGVRVYAN